MLTNVKAEGTVPAPEHSK